MKKRIAVLTGAGVSAESGLGTFRDSDASAEGWSRDPGLVLDFYNMQREKLRDVQPNEAHRLIAALEKDYTVDVITQNVDNLHERAGSTHVVHLHGEATKVRPENTCNDYDGYSEKYVVDVGYDAVRLGDKAPNGAQYRPHIVFFGEAVPKIERAVELVAAADIVLIVGTSLQVYPAAGLYRYARPEAPIYLIDPADVTLRDPRVHHIKAVATKGMQEFVGMLK